MVESEKDRLFHMLRTCKPWNEEQLQVMDGLKHVKGSMSIVLGPAGSGKTTLNRAISLSYWCLGFLILQSRPQTASVITLLVD